MSRLVQLRHGSGAVMTVSAAHVDKELIYLCGREACAHWQGQPGLPTMAAAADMRCALVGYAPAETCQAEYLDRVVEIDTARRALWDRLDEAERLERRRHAAAAIRSAAG